MPYPTLQNTLILALVAGLVHSAPAAELAKAAELAGKPPVALDGIRLTDQRGAAIEPASFGAGPVLVQFIFTRCPAACPLQTRQLAAVRRALPVDVQDRVQFLSISVDPQRDTAEALSAFARRMGADLAGWRFATGDPASIQKLLQRLGVLDPAKAAPQPIDHRLNLYLYDRTGMPVIRYSGNPVDQPRLVDDLTQIARLGR